MKGFYFFFENSHNYIGTFSIVLQERGILELVLLPTFKNGISNNYTRLKTIRRMIVKKISGKKYGEYEINYLLVSTDSCARNEM